MIKNISIYIGQRIILTIIALIVLSFITFSLSYIVPGDAALVAAGPNAGKEKIEQLRSEMGLNLPFHKQYAVYLSKLADGDLGKSWFTHQPILEDIKDLLPASAELVFFAMLFNIIIAIPLGIIAATRRDSKTDMSIRFLVTFGAGIPIFWLGLLLQHFLAAEAELFPIAGRLSFSNRNFETDTGFIFIDSIAQGEWSVLIDSIWHIILPAFTLSVLFIAVITRTTRSTLMKALEEDFIVLARSKGISEFRVVVRHGLRNAMVPTITILGMQIGWMMGATVLVEEIFGRPGIGKYAVKAVTQSDIHAIVGVVLIVGIIFIISNLVVDIIHFFLNPRLRIN